MAYRRASLARRHSEGAARVPGSASKSAPRAPRQRPGAPRERQSKPNWRRELGARQQCDIFSLLAKLGNISEIHGIGKTFRKFMQKVAYRCASFAGLGLEDAAGAAQTASGSLPGAPKRRKKVLLAMEKWTHAKNNKKIAKKHNLFRKTQK